MQEIQGFGPTGLESRAFTEVASPSQLLSVATTPRIVSRRHKTKEQQNDYSEV